MWKYVLALLALLIVAPAAAQPIPLYGHPQLEAYASAADCPVIDGQGWFGNPNPLLASHVHVVTQACLYMRVLSRELFNVPFTVKLHKIAGNISQVSGPQIKSIWWEDTNSDQMPDLTGDVNGLKEWRGVATFDPTLLLPGDDLHIFDFPTHGWAGLRFFTRTNLGDGTSRYVDVISTLPVYSLIDPSAPEHQSPQQGNPGVTLRTSVTVWDPRPGGGAPVGEVITEIDDYIPLVPFVSPFKTIGNLYNYTAPVTLVGANAFDFRKDADLHHGVLGALMRTEPAQSNRSFFGDLVIDPAQWGTGAHKGMAIWTQNIGTEGAEAVSSVLVFPFTVGMGVPPPALCTDPKAPNFGGPLPCLPPIIIVPPPVDVCPNIDGVQETLPAGMVFDNGQCVTPPPPPLGLLPPGTYTLCNSESRCSILIIR